MAATTTKKKLSHVKCPRCEKPVTLKAAEKLFHGNKSSRTGFQTWCKKHAREIDAEKKAAKAGATGA
jgi:endogenous inhibitor of DNA gyrase (YacG/DUF329 family)